MEDYGIYHLSFRQMCVALGAGALAAGIVSYTFYRSIAVFLVFLIPACFAPRYFRNYWKEKRLHLLEVQFKEAIQMLSAALSAGYSIENAIGSCRKELELLYGQDGMICKEFAHMEEQLGMNRPIEVLMDDFARRSGLAEVENFARIFVIAKRSGGRLVSVIGHTVQIMDDRFRVKEEISLLTASRRMEQRIMNLVPFLMILYIDLTSPGFFGGMYTTDFGRLVMTGCLLVYLLSVYWAGKILKIETA